MHVIVAANKEQKEALRLKHTNKDVYFEFTDTLQSSYKNADAILILNNAIDLNLIRSLTRQPVFLHSVILTLANLDVPGSVCRINAWPTFIKNDIVEVAAKDENMVKVVFEKLGWKYMLVPDEPGFIAPRILSMIVNEAYFTYGEGISSKEEIDAAMKLGTNYPYGPFEWAEKIGLINIYTLLKALNENSLSYNIAPAMKKELANVIA